ncbi:membrane protein, putative [Rhodovulum sp. P5]|uniref:sulfite exporter TauE/SafE family protein n=1 Tax=Rhodovulum sp. P5 TaxID=1564506 RepID=UPI0009C2A7B9|nr:sulfite exporter TauE/SafE family protein [Rhodovulum sp. P5]ARE38743.1 membrane protein, putative [Rhodovulum sp. P5]
MEIYLPIADVAVNAFTLLGIGGLVGVLSGMFGVGGGFLITPMLFFIGIPPAVAVATSANQIVASSFSGVLAHFRRRTVDLKMGTVLLLGGLVGVAVGVVIFNQLRQLGQVDLFVKLCYVLFLGVIGTMMFVESLQAIRRTRSGRTAPKRRHRKWVSVLPFKTKFRVSGLYISAVPPLLVGAAVGMLSAIMGVGGGFIMVPAMIYLLGMPTKVVVGTSLFQIIFVTAFTTLLHATTNYTVDMGLALLLLVGGVIGAQFGTRIGLKMKAEQLRVLLAALVMAVCGKLALDLLLKPSELYTLTSEPGVQLLSHDSRAIPPRAQGNDM